MVYINEGPNYNKGKKAYDIAVVDAVTEEKIAWYTGYYNAKTKKLKLYPNYLTKYGKKIKYNMEVQTISTNQIKNFD
jgi:RNA-binding protein YlmH